MLNRCMVVGGLGGGGGVGYSLFCRFAKFKIIFSILMKVFLIQDHMGWKLQNANQSCKLHFDPSQTY